MATLYKNGTELARVQKHSNRTDQWGATEYTITRACMSNRRILEKVSYRSGGVTHHGTWKRYSKLKEDATTAGWLKAYLAHGWQQVKR